MPTSLPVVPVERPQLMTGIQAICQGLMELTAGERAAGRNTAVLVSGYPGSPLAGLDLALHRIKDLTEVHDVHHVPGLNEELAATALWGSQTITPEMGRTRDGVIGVWYGKAPGFDRSGDAFRHGNLQGVDPRGGVVVLVGDDPSCKSSTVPSSSEPAAAELMMPVLSPVDADDVVRLLPHAVALSRASGCWVAMKITTDVADGVWTSSGEPLPEPVVPEVTWQGQPWTYTQGGSVLPPNSLTAEAELLGPRWEAVKAYGAANQLNEITVDAPGATVGILTSGKTYADLRQALGSLGLDDAALAGRGVRLLRVRMPFPLDRRVLETFAEGLDELLVIEDKRPFLEAQVRDLLYDAPFRPRILGKHDADGLQLVPHHGEVNAAIIAGVLRRFLGLGEVEAAAPSVLSGLAATPLDVIRTPYFCSGCPHNRSTVIPDGSLAAGGIGCHAMVAVAGRPQSAVTALTQMGGEGTQWIGQAPFSSTRHIFQNLGDGTFAHSGQLAIQAAVAAGVTMTFKLLYNSHVSMTGGQHAVGSMSVPAITRAASAWGVQRIVVVAANPEGYGPSPAFARGVEVINRDDFDEAQHELRETEGVSLLIYDQRCAAESRRLRKKGDLPTPTMRVIVNERVCEACGDCGVKSNCLSLQAVDTEFGPKTRIEQSSCNTDYSCLDGDCPSFVTVDVPVGASTASKAAAVSFPAAPDVPEPVRPETAELFLAGIGGTGIVTVSRIIGTAAATEGLHVSALDQTGLSQKAGPVTSHLRIAPTDVAGNRLSPGTATGYLAFDALVGADAKNLAAAGPGTVAVVSTAWVPPGRQVGAGVVKRHDTASMAERIGAVATGGPVTTLDTMALAHRLFGGTVTANMLLLGAAYQRGLLPVSSAALEAAIKKNGQAVAANLAAFAWGRAVVADPSSLPADSLTSSPMAAAAEVGDALLNGSTLAGETRRLAAIRAGELVAYQGERLARAYLRSVETVWAAERRAGERTELSEAVAAQLYRLTAYKDEYEVARLLTDPSFDVHLAQQAPGAVNVKFRLHPPALRSLGMKKKIALGAWAKPMLRGLSRGKVVRGSALDPFGYAKVRRAERAVASDYRQRISALLPSLSAESYDRAVEIARAAELVRGYEDIKLDNIRRYHERVAALSS